MDLLTYLLLNFVESKRGPQNSAADADLSGQELELMCGLDTNAELHALGGYVTMSLEEKGSLPPAVHEWFIERFSHRARSWAEANRVPEVVVEGIADVYLLHISPMADVLAVSALLTVDACRDSDETAVSRIWRRILRDSEAPSHELIDLTEVLFDLHVLARQPYRAIRALGELRRIRPEGERYEEIEGFLHSFDTYTLERATALGGEEGSELRSLLRHPEER